MFKFNKRAVLALMLAVIVITTALSFAACAGRTEPNPEASLDISEVSSPDSSSDAEKSGPSFINPLPAPTTASEIGVLDTGYMLMAQEKHEINSDTVGWLNQPNSILDDVILWYPGDRNSYYLRRDFNKVPNTGPLASQYGSYFADYRCKFDGGAAGLSPNTVIYGHSMEDNPNGNGFSQLKKFLDEDYARKNPYIYFSTTDEDMAWEVFAVSYATTDLVYNKPALAGAEFDNIIKEARARSVFNYDTEVTSDDKILTLSTCCYNFTTAYPNNYRFFIMAKLVSPGEKLADEASLVKNPSPAKP